MQPTEPSEVAIPSIPIALPYSAPSEATCYASFGRRMVAWMIDVCILTAVRFTLFGVMGGVAIWVENAGLDSDNTKVTLVFTLIALLYLCAWPYYALLEGSARQGTVGKLAMGIRVEDIEGGCATRVQTSVRFFLRLVSALLLGCGFLMAAFTRRRQALHDIGANCIVTMNPRSPH